MTYEEQLRAAHVERRRRLSRRAPAAGPLVMKPGPRVILIGPDGRQMRPRPVVAAPALAPGSPSAPMAAQVGDVPVEVIARLVAQEFGVGVSDLRGKRRMTRMVIPRHMAMILAGRLTKHSTPQIGRLLGGFDHTSVLNARKKWPLRVAADPALKAKEEDLVERLREHARRPVIHALSNLCWGTPAENGDDKVRNGRSCAGEKQGGSKLTERDVIDIRARIAEADCRELGAEFKVTPQNIRRIVMGETWRHLL